MNERIKQLALQAGLKWKAQPPHYTNTNNPIDFPVSANRDLEKFAELIVAECIKQVEPTQHHEVWAQSYLGGVDGLDLLYSKIKDIKKHFGVEE
jgi:hypothetical protein